MHCLTLDVNADKTDCNSLFNAFLPSWLERKEAAHQSTDQIQELQDFLYFTLAGVPGAILGAVLVEMPWLGQRRSMAL